MLEIGNKTITADVDLIDESFDISQSENYHLSMQICQDRLSFCVYNHKTNKYICLRNYPLSCDNIHDTISECQMIFEHDDLLKLRYRKSKNMLISPRFTLVPKNLYDKNSKDLYLTFNHGIKIGEQTLQNPVKPANLYNIFSYPEKLRVLLKRYQTGINLYHHATLIIDKVINDSSTVIAACFYSGYLDIVILENGKLLFYNTFLIDAPEDSVYYLIVVSNLFEINLKSTKLIYAGNYEHIPPEIAILNNYVECIVECEPPTTETYSDLITEALRKRFINLFYLYGCE